MLTMRAPLSSMNASTVFYKPLKQSSPHKHYRTSTTARALPVSEYELNSRTNNERAPPPPQKVVRCTVNLLLLVILLVVALLLLYLLTLVGGRALRGTAGRALVVVAQVEIESKT